jgi:DNA-binding CsgD family transcriptional regulator
MTGCSRALDVVHRHLRQLKYGLPGLLPASCDRVPAARLSPRASIVRAHPHEGEAEWVRRAPGVKRARKLRRPPDPNALTANQRSILLRLFAGKTYDEVSIENGRRPSTIFSTTRRVRVQLGIRTDFDVMRECVRRGIVTLDEIYALADIIRPPDLAEPGKRDVVRAAPSMLDPVAIRLAPALILLMHNEYWAKQTRVAASSTDLLIC